MRPYYRNLALLHEHYDEVDTLLSGELPSTIAQSFKQPTQRPSYTRMIIDLEDDAAGQGGTPPWIRRGSAWKVKKPTERTDENEEDPLLPQSEARDAKRERIAKLALNGMSVYYLLKLICSSQHCCQCPLGCCQSRRGFVLCFHISDGVPGRLSTGSAEYLHNPGNELGDRCSNG